MRPLALTGLCVASAMGVGLDATFDALRTGRSGLVPCDFAGIGAEGGYVGLVGGLDAHRLPPPLARFDCRNNRLADLALGTDGFAAAVAAARERHGPERIAVVVGTSTSGILSLEEAWLQKDPASGALPAWFDYAGSHDMLSLAAFVRARLGLSGPALTLSTACASTARSFLDAWHLIESGACDAAVVGGADTLCRLTLRGFAALDLVSPGPCRPCDAERGGISIGEAAGFALLEREGAVPARKRESAVPARKRESAVPARERESAVSAGEREGAGIALVGCGASSDGYHMSAPDPAGGGAIGAMRAALASAGLSPEAIDYVNLHGTGTRANDAMEDLAVTAVFGTATPCSSTKGWSGHTLGAAGMLEAAIAAICLREGFIPGCLGLRRRDPGFRAAVVAESRAAELGRVMSNSFGFGGINCSLIFASTA